jgi:hypothetical protein
MGNESLKQGVAGQRMDEPRIRSYVPGVQDRTIRTFNKKPGL